MEHIPYLWPVFPQYELTEGGVIRPQIPLGMDSQHPAYNFVMSHIQTFGIALLIIRN